MLLQREANALAMQQKWNSLDEGSRLTLNLLSKEIDLRNGEVKQGVIGMKQIFEAYMHADTFLILMFQNTCKTFGAS